MLAIFIACASILAITGFVWLIKIKVCPICAGVSLTWLWILIGMSAGWLSGSSYQLIVGILMGGSVVGIAYVNEKRLVPGRSSLAWKSAFIPAGFVAAYAIVTERWPIAAAFGAILLVLSWFFLLRGRKAITSAGVDALEKKMEQCC